MTTYPQVKTAIHRFSHLVDARLATTSHYQALERIRDSYRGTLPQADFAVYAYARRHYAQYLASRQGVKAC